jgi:hypothetical protein
VIRGGGWTSDAFKNGNIVINRFIGTPMVEALHATPLLSHDTTHLSDKTMSSISPKSGSLPVVLH